MKKKSAEQVLGSVLSLRVPAKTRASLVLEASAMGRKLSDHLFDMLALGIETNQARLKAEKAAAMEQATPKEEPGEIRTDAGEASGKVKPQRQGEPKRSGAPETEVDEAFLTAIKLKYPALNHEKLLARLEEVLKESGKQMTRKTVERLFEIAGKAEKR